MVISNDTALKVLADLIKINSVNGNELEVAQYIQSFLKEYNIDSQIIEISKNRANLVAEIGSGNPVLAITGHMDVVAAGDLTAWKYPPFELTEESDQLFGRGVTDMKAGLAAMLIAMVELNHQGLPKKGTIRLLATMGEEVGEEGSAFFFEQGYMEDVAGLIVGEPSSIYGTAFEQKGSCDIKFTSEGKAVHSSTPDKGYNAILPLMRLLNEAEEYFNDASHTGDMGPLCFNIDVLKGGDQINSIPAHAEAMVNIRTIPEFDNQQVLQKLDELVKKYNQNGSKIKTEIIMDEWPIASTRNNKLVQLIQEVSKQFIEDDIIVAPSPGITDASNLAKDKGRDFPFAIYGPGAMSQHQVNEWLPKTMYFNFVKLYQKLFVKFLE